MLQDMEFVTRGDRRIDADNDGISAAEMLRKFCEWQSSVNTLDDSSPYHHDTALLLTRYSCERRGVCVVVVHDVFVTVTVRPSPLPGPG
jgi:hypothetical protein